MSGESGGGRAHRGQRTRNGQGHGAAPAGSGRAATVAELTRLLAPAVSAGGFDLEEVDVRPAGRRRLVRIVVDADGGIGLDDVAELSELASGLLDSTDVMGSGPYVLEVTSPGVDRPLTEPRHWRRAAGRLVVAPLSGGGQIEGRVVEADDQGVVIDVIAPRKGSGPGKGAPKGSKGPGGAGPKTTRRRFALGDLGRGRVQVEFRPSGEPGQGAKPETRSPAEPD